jgi:hypothetical protein
MPSPRDPEELAQALADAEELARQRVLALDIRDMRLTNRRERELEGARKRARRAADLLHLEEILSHSGVSQVDYVLQPKATDAGAKSAPQEAPSAETKTP